MLLLLQVTELSLYCRRYLREFSTDAPVVKMESQVFAKDNQGPAKLFAYKSRQIFETAYPGIAFEEPILQRVTPDGKTVFLRKAGMGAVQHQSWELSVDVNEPALLAVPLNYDLKFRAWIDGTETKVEKVYGAFCGVAVPPGVHKIKFTPAPDPYPWIVSIQTLLYIGIIVQILLSLFKTPQLAQK